MLMRFEKFKLIKENPDVVWDNEPYNSKYYSWEDDEARPFFIKVNKDHTKVTNIYFGNRGQDHGSIRISSKEYVGVCYPGRFWKKSKIMSFWVYPNEILFIDLIKTIEEKLDLEIFNNGWRIEVLKLKKDNEIVKKEFDDNKIDDYYSDYSIEPWEVTHQLIPIENYVGSENVPEEQLIQHLMSWKEKELAKKMGKIHFKGFGSYKTGWDQPKNIKYRQALYQERKKY